MKEMTVKKKIAMPRIVYYSIGLLFVSMGISTMLTTRLGMAPTSSLPVTIYEVMQLFTAGRWVTILHIGFVISAIAVSKKVRLSHVLSFVTVVLLGYLIDLFEIIITPLIPEGLLIRLIIVLVSCVVISIGASFLLLSEYPPIPDLLLFKEIEKRYSFPVGRAKLITDVSCVVIASVLSYFVLHEFVHIGIGTVISALILGTLITKAKPFIGRHFTNTESKSKKSLVSMLDYNLIDVLAKK